MLLLPASPFITGKGISAMYSPQLAPAVIWMFLKLECVERKLILGH
jgi:hypothetical protein